MIQKRPVWRARTLAVVVILAACGCDSGVGTNANGSIRGTAIDNIGATIAGVAVVLTGNAQPGRTANSGADGVYVFEHVPAGAYSLAVTHAPGYEIGDEDAATVTIASGEQAAAPALVLYSCEIQSGSPGVEFFGGVATDADRSLFDYDAHAPLNLQKTVEVTVGGVQRIAISFSSPDGGTVPGLLFDPVERSGPRPGIVYVQGFPGFARGAPTVATAQLLAEHGAVVIVIDLPMARRSGLPVQFTAEDRAEQIQLIKDLQRGVDVLRAQPKVDNERIAFVGHSYGGSMGALFVGIERRIKAAVLMSADGGLVTHSLPYLSGLSCSARNAWLRAMMPIEPLRFIAHAPPIALLLQNGHLDSATSPADAMVLHDAPPEPSTLLWYDAEHGLNDEALFDRLIWLHEQIGLDPPA